MVMKQTTLNLGGKLFSLENAAVMGIVNVTPDSFYAGSRVGEETKFRNRIKQIISEGGTMVDIGAYSSRPGAADISPAEEMERLRPGLKILRDEFPGLPVSVDTFRSDVAAACVEEYNVAMINDISGGQIDPKMFETVARLNVPYILMHMRGTPETMQQFTKYKDIAVDVLDYFIQKTTRLRELGVKDIVLDPGFGFSKTTLQNYELMARMDEITRILPLPLLVGISRKSMIYKLFDSTPQEALNGTTALNTYSLLHGADILRVHDVREAIECVRIVGLLKKGEQLKDPSHYKIGNNH